ncbi:putative HVA22-like protein g [Aristolochia californica]|uniref:putative HVA22-like protein g n=1 Tax=Aristolochia californica TaxID=171875 RepID=UPI0035DC4AB6
MLGDLITSCLILLFGYIYPAFECFKSVEVNKADIEQLRFWCQYWIIVAGVIVFERFGDILISWVPMYGEMKLAFFIFLWHPKTKGTSYVYQVFLRPYVARNETDIDHNLSEMRARAWDMAILYWQSFADLGQAKFFEVLRYLAAQSYRPSKDTAHVIGTRGFQSPLGSN